MSPDPEIGALLFSLLFSFVLTLCVSFLHGTSRGAYVLSCSNGVLQPFSQLGWWRWMYRISPFTYLIEGLLGQSLGKQDINCAAVEFVQINPPMGLTCAQYMNPYMAVAGGYLTNPEALAACHFCSTRTTDQFLGLSFNIFYSHRWRDVGFMLAFSLFNVRLSVHKPVWHCC